MNGRPYSKNEMIEFVRENNYNARNASLNTLNEVREQLRIIEENRKDEVHHDEWLDDEILQQTEAYLEYLETAIPREEANIKNARDISLVSRKGYNKVPLDIERDIQSFVVEGGKMRKKSRKSRKTKRSRKTKKSRKTRKHRRR